MRDSEERDRARPVMVTTVAVTARQAAALTVAVAMSIAGCGRVSFAPLDAGLDAGEGGVDAGPDASTDGAVDAGDARADGDAGVQPLPDGVYRSVGPGVSAALATGGSNALTIEGARASFAAALPDRVGVGDVLQYDSDDDGVVDALAFVHRRDSATVYRVAAEDGSAPTPTVAPDEDWALHRAYTSLARATSGSTNPLVALPFDAWTGGNDLVALGASWHIACYADAPDAERVFVRGWVTSATHQLRIFTPRGPPEAGVSQRHAGVWDTTRYHLTTPPSSNDRAIDVVDAFVWIDGLQIHVVSDGAMGDLPYGIDMEEFTASRVGYASNNIIWSNDMPRLDGAIPRGIKAHAAELGAAFHFWNNIIYEFGGGEVARAIEMTGAAATAYVYNNTIVDVTPGIYINDVDDVLHARNNVALLCGTNCFDGNGTYLGSNNRSGDDSAPSLGIGAQLSSEAITSYFVDLRDYHLGRDAPNVAELRDVGLDLSADPDLPFASDVDGEPRAAPWDVGADEL